MVFFSNYYDILKKDESLQRDIAYKDELINHSICFDNSYCTSTHVVFNLDACPPYWKKGGELDDLFGRIQGAYRIHLCRFL